MKLGFELPNEDRDLTGEELEKLRAIGAEVVRLRYVREDVVRQCLEVKSEMDFIVRPPWDGKIEPEKWGKALADGTKLIANMGGKPLQNLVNEPNHPDGPYADSPGSFGPDYDALKTATWKDTSWLTVSPNLTVKASDIEWAKRYKEQFRQSLYIGFSDYWQYENELSYDWGLRVIQLRRIWPEKWFIALEVGDSTEERTSRERAEHIARNLIALHKLGYVDMACIFMLGGTARWRKFYLDVEDCRYIREEFDRAMKEEPLMPEPKTIGEKVVARARSWKGKLTYCYGGKTPQDGCADCSWLVYDAVTHATGEMFASAGGTWWQLQACKGSGREARLEDLKTPGIVFWDDNPQSPTPGHVGIATGEGTVVELTDRYNGVVEMTIQEWLPHVHSCWRMPWGGPEPTPEPQCENCKRLKAELEQEQDRLVRIQKILLEE